MMVLRRGALSYERGTPVWVIRENLVQSAVWVLPSKPLIKSAGFRYRGCGVARAFAEDQVWVEDHLWVDDHL